MTAPEILDELRNHHLFNLGITNIHLAPKPPQFVNDDILDFRVQTFDLHLTGDARQDLESLPIDRDAA